MTAIKIRLEKISKLLGVDAKHRRIEQIENEINSADFWLDEKTANLRTKELKNLKTEVKKFDELNELAQIAESDEDLSELDSSVAELEKLSRFDGKYDANSAIVSFYAGAGGDDAQDWAQMLMRMYIKWAENHKYEVKILDQSSGGIAGIKSATMEIVGPYIYGQLKRENGVHRLVRQSPFNAKSLRQTSFALVEILPLVEDGKVVEIDDAELKIDTYRASGRGGQGVNTTDSAVRITHLPTGIVVTCQNERSQLQNKQSAMSVLRSRLAKMLEEQHKEKIAELRGEQSEPEWGSQIRSYILHPYKMVKDHRNNFESSEPDKVLNGEIDAFLNSNLDS